MKVHPVAELFPMMSEEELADLAQDMKANGQIHPIITAVIDKEETLIDGRNRLRACEIAGIKPRKEQLNGQDPVAYILSSNDRRDMTQGQRAIVAALCHNLLQRGEPAELARSLKVPRQRVSEAIIIARHTPDLAEQVRIGNTPFQPALERARQIKRDTEDTADKMAQLRAEAPDLADLNGISLDEAIARLERRHAEDAQLKTIEDDAPDLVAAARNGVITVADAMAAFTDRESKKQAAQSGATMLLARVVGLLGVAGDPKQSAAELMQNLNLKMWPQEQDDVTSAHLKACADWFAECAKILKSREK